jgi:hypothetical protein
MSDHERIRHNHSDELGRLLESYRAACPDPAPSGNFMPELWSRIDARRRADRVFGAVGRRVLAAAGALTLVLGILVYVPYFVHEHNDKTYLEALTDEPAYELAEFVRVSSEQR